MFHFQMLNYTPTCFTKGYLDKAERQDIIINFREKHKPELTFNKAITGVTENTEVCNTVYNFKLRVNIQAYLMLIQF